MRFTHTNVSHTVNATLFNHYLHTSYPLGVSLFTKTTVQPFFRRLNEKMNNTTKILSTMQNRNANEAHPCRVNILKHSSYQQVNPMQSNKVQKLLPSDSPRTYVPKKKKLRFAKTSTLIMIPKVSCNNWYTKSEISEFKRDIRHSVAEAAEYSKVMKCIGYSIQEGTALKSFDVDESVCGLEHLISPEICRILTHFRKLTVAKVLKEQERQLVLREHDSNKIATVSEKYSKFVVEWRRLIAEL